MGNSIWTFLRTPKFQSVKMALTTLAKSLRVSKSSNMFEAFVVISSMYNFSKGWYTYLTLSVSTNVCCLPVFISFGKAARRPSIRDRVISTNCREIMAAMKNRNICNHIKQNFTWVSFQLLYLNYWIVWLLDWSYLSQPCCILLQQGVPKIKVDKICLWNSVQNGTCTFSLNIYLEHTE